MKNYDHKKIEKKWQKEWEKENLYLVKDKVKGKKNFYTLAEFSYPSGNLHVGHWYAFGVTDIFARFKRMQGFNVLYPMGFDAFGLPAENAAINLGADPKVWTYKQMGKMRLQLRSIGAMFDWSREVVTCDPGYYKWTQWMFGQFLKNDLVYRAITKVNWCPKDQTILANEQVVGGFCDRCGAEVEQRNEEQWMLRITKYADRLIDDLEKLDWPEEIKAAQKNWIGRSEGALIEFEVQDYKVSVFTTRPDTIFGATYIVLAPEHDLVLKLKDKITNWNEVEKYVLETKKRSELSRQQSKEKTGVELKGVMAVNPATKGEIPVWIADYVLANYGTGAIMAVPAHDERDFEFAKKYNLPIRQVIMLDNLDVKNPPRPEKENTTRNIIHAILRNPKDKTVLIECLKGEQWGENKPMQFIIGGIEEGEKEVDAAMREIREETGYLNFRFVEKVSFDVQSKFFAAHKDVNREVHVHTLVFDLLNLEKTEIIEDEYFKKDSQEIKWVPYDKVYSTLTLVDAQMAWKYFYEGGFAYGGNGIMINSGKFDGMDSEKAKKEIIKFVGGKEKTTFKLRDWGISRQRYWGTPIPIVYDPKGGAHLVPDKHLPWLLPKDVDHKPSGVAPLAKSKELLKRTEKIFGKGWRPEVETMDTFVDSSWYFYRYLDSKNNKKFVDKKHSDAWMPVDLYMGGAEHTTMHLLYSRFWIKAMYDLGLVKDEEAYKVRRNRGLILGPDGNKMSKSKGNVINPDEIVEKLGADTVRMYLCFMGPYGVTVNYPWDPNGVVGLRRFLERVWRFQNKIGKGSVTPLLHKAIKKMTEDMGEYKFNTSITQMMMVVNEWEKAEFILKSEYKILLQILSPFAPHITEELWQTVIKEVHPGAVLERSIHLSAWPKWDENLIKDEEIKIAIQVNGKVRAELMINIDEDEETIKERALQNENVLKFVSKDKIRKVIYVKNRLINIVL